jgi:hypothetical protein
MTRWFQHKEAAPIHFGAYEWHDPSKGDISHPPVHLQVEE